MNYNEIGKKISNNQTDYLNFPTVPKDVCAIYYRPSSVILPNRNASSITFFPAFFQESSDYSCRIYCLIKSSRKDGLLMKRGASSYF